MVIKMKKKFYFNQIDNFRILEITAEYDYTLITMEEV